MHSAAGDSFVHNKDRPSGFIESETSAAPDPAVRPLLQTRGLVGRFASDGHEVIAVRDVSLQVEPGEYVVVMGSSGSGKSTLLGLLAGLSRPSAGEVIFDGVSLAGLDERRLALLRRQHVGFVFQAIHLVPNLTLLENVLVAGLLVPGRPEAVRARALELLAQLDLHGQALRLPAQVSGGEQQRAAIARALINRPSVLFADEPTGALNSAAAARVLDALVRVHAAGQTVVLVTHDVRAACRGQRVLFLRDGAIDGELRLAGDPVADLRTRELQLVRWLSARGW